MSYAGNFKKAYEEPNNVSSTAKISYARSIRVLGSAFLPYPSGDMQLELLSIATREEQCHISLYNEPFRRVLPHSFCEHVFIVNTIACMITTTAAIHYNNIRKQHQ
ncbi:hypothetical protein Droror1_Dr00004542 [Drosera rotundifolia]